jgi:cytochrome c oxidase assembly protein subunit 15
MADQLLSGRVGGLRSRLRTVSPDTFRRISYLALAALFVVIASGAVVRLTASGLGCENWPRCGETTLPRHTGETGYHAFVEFGNRLIALLAIAGAATAAFAARRVSGLPPWIRRGWAGVALLILAQIPLGGLTVLLDLHPLLVMTHFALALVALGLAVVVTVGAWAFTGPPQPRTVPRIVAWGALALVPLALGLVVSGAFVTAAGPHSGGEDIERLGNLVDSLWWHVRVSAAFGIGYLALLVWLWRYAGDYARGELVLGLVTLGFLVVQMVVGEVQWRSQLPAWLVFVHVMLATTVWAGMVALAARLVARRAPRST